MSGKDRILLHLSGDKKITYKSWPVTQGIPFADGVLERNTPVQVVDEDGNVFPTQSRCLATWNKDLRYVKWLLVDFQADWKQRKGKKLFLEYGKDIKPVLPEMPVTVEDKDGEILINTGVLQFVLSKKTEVFISCKVKRKDRWVEMFSEGSGMYLYMKDQYDNIYEGCRSGVPPQIIIEETGPLRASICIKGYHLSSQGLRFCPYIIRLHFFAGKRDIRLFHTFIFDQEPHLIELKSIGIKLPLNVGKQVKMSVGTDKGHCSSSGMSLSILQETDQRYKVSLSKKKLEAGKRAPGWAKLQGSYGSATAVIRYFWQEYPKGFILNKDIMDIQIWPEGYKDTLKFTTPFEKPAIFFNGTRSEEEVKRLLDANPDVPLNLKSFKIETEKDFLWVEKIVEKYCKGRVISYNDTGTDNGMGAAKTTEIYLSFSTEEVSDSNAMALCNMVQEPLLAIPDPVYTCSTKAMGHTYPAGNPVFSEIDESLDDILNLVAIEPIERCHLYGMMRYGNMVCSHAPGPSISYVYYKDKEPEKALRFVGPYNNEANDQIGAVWGNFIRTGKREHYFLAQRYSRNVADVCFIHADPLRPERIGLMHYHNAHQWSGGPSPSHSLVRGLLLDYYFTGNQRLLEVAKETADWCVRMQEPCGVISCRNGVLHREFTGPLWNLLEVYQATWEEKYGALARRSLNWFLRTLPEPGNYPVSVYTYGERGDEAVVEPPGGCTGHARDMYYLFEIAYRLFPSQTLRKHILAEVDHFLWDEPIDNYFTADMAKRMLTNRSKLWQIDSQFYYTQWATPPVFFMASGGLVCMAYDITGDLRYAAYAKHILQKSLPRQFKMIRRFIGFGFTWISFGSFVPALMRTVADALEKDPTGLEEAEKEWKQKRAELKNPVYEGNGVDFDKDTMDALGNITSREPAPLSCEGPVRRYEPRINIGRISTEDLP